MMGAVHNVALVLMLLAFTTGQRSQVEEALLRRLACVQHETCAPCLLAATQVLACRWCADPYFARNTSAPRCNDEASLVEAGCAQYFIVAPEQPASEVAESRPLRDRLPGPGNAEAAVQIQPQRVRVKLKPQQSMRVQFTYRPARNYPLDLYYLMDLTWSMKDDKETLVSLRDDLPVMLMNLTDNFRLGFGSFAEKPLMPYTIMDEPRLSNPCAAEEGGLVCEPTYSFRHHLPLTDEVSEFIRRVNSSSMTGNRDNAEAGLDALLQALVCGQVGWHRASRKILILLTDGLLHFAGDGRLGGAIERNDEKCYLDENGFYIAADKYDYPSLAQIYRLLNEKKVNVIFAVTEQVKTHYDSLHRLLGQHTYVSKLEADSSNILKLVKQGYEDIVSTVNFEDDAAAPLHLAYYSDCGVEGGEMVETKSCTGVEFGKSYNFEVLVKMESCPEFIMGQKQTITIRDTQLGQDSLALEVELLCGCSCEDKREEVESLCPMNSQLVCGVCQCVGAWSGPNCDCKVSDHAASVSLSAQCRHPNATRPLLCSGAGDCLCGQCDCDPRRSGKYCECKPCPINPDNGLMCGGAERGVCACSACVCDVAWTGDSCACPASQHTCVAPADTKLCSGHGDCVCGKCQCSVEDGMRYAGEFCETCASCVNSVCGVCSECVACTLTNNCTTQCEGDVRCQVTVNITDTGSEAGDPRRAWCVVRLEEGGQECEYGYTYGALGPRAVSADVRTKRCAQLRGAMIMTSGLIIMAFTIAVGILVIAAVKSAQVVADRRAYAQFQKEAERSMLAMSSQNPLYISPISEFTLPESFPRDNM